MPSFTASPGVWNNVNATNFRAWGSYIAAQLLAVGLVKTSDTGQIDWTTVAAPGGVDTYMGYEIWRFADALQATAPVYIKIEYGSSSVATAPSVRIQFGSGSNGSGTLTGNLSSQFISAVTSVTANAVVVGSGSTNRFCIAAGFTTAGGYGMFFGFERSKDASGNDTAEAVLAVFSNASTATSTSTRFFPVWSTTLGNLGTVTQIAAPAIFPPGTTAATGSQVIVCPILHCKGVFMNPGMNFAGYFTENIAVNGTPSVYVYGASRTYYSLPAASAIASTGWQGPGGGTEALLIRYE